MKVTLRIAILLCLGFLVIGCVSNEKHDPSRSAAYKSFQVPSDTSRIYFKTGIFVPVITDVMEHRFFSTLYINDSEIGIISSGQVMVVDVKPGNYTLSWLRKGMTDGYVITKKEINLKPGEYVIASSDLKQSGAEQGGAVLGLLGALAGSAMRPSGEYSIGISDEKKQIDVSNFIKPANCPASFCKAN